MAESPEHAFLSATMLDLMVESAKCDLFVCRESERKRFDFSCNVTRDWTRAISGQTLWKHDRDGIDKDLRTLLTDDDSLATVYVARDSVAVRGRVDEILQDYRRTALASSLSKLRILWVPGDFDADDERSRGVVREALRREVYRDLLLKVVLGGLTAPDVKNLVKTNGYAAWVLAQIHSEVRLEDYTTAYGRYGIEPRQLTQELMRLELIGMVSRGRDSEFHIEVTEKGRAMAEIYLRINAYLRGWNDESEEFLYICKLLGAKFSSVVDGRCLPDYRLIRRILKTANGIGFDRVDNASLLVLAIDYAAGHERHLAAIADADWREWPHWYQTLLDIGDENVVRLAEREGARLYPISITRGAAVG
jgi:hypothetical protein